MSKRRALIVCSSGGHLDQALLVLPAFDDYDVVFATFNKRDAISRLKDYRWHRVYYPTNRNIINLIRNTFVAIKVILRERPHIVMSTGAAAAVPFFVIARLFGTQTVYLECIDRVSFPTMTARMVKHFTSANICQVPNQMAGWPRRINLGYSR